MKCLRCGYCCIKYDVMIVDKPKLGIKEGNVLHKPSGKKCQHLRGSKGKYSCAIHNEKFFKKTPCASHGQIEHGDTNCRMGDYILHNKSY